MRKLALLALLAVSNVLAAPAHSLNAKELANTILNMHKTSVSNKGSFAMVYGGQDISRANGGQIQNVGNPILVG